MRKIQITICTVFKNVVYQHNSESILIHCMSSLGVNTDFHTFRKYIQLYWIQSFFILFCTSYYNSCNTGKILSWLNERIRHYPYMFFTKWCQVCHQENYLYLGRHVKWFLRKEGRYYSNRTEHNIPIVTLMLLQYIALLSIPS